MILTSSVWHVAAPRAACRRRSGAAPPSQPPPPALRRGGGNCGLQQRSCPGGHHMFRRRGRLALHAVVERAEPPAPPAKPEGDGSWTRSQWAVFAATYVSYAACYLARNNSAVAKPRIGAVLGFTDSTLGTLDTSFLVMRAPAPATAAAAAVPQRTLRSPQRRLRAGTRSAPSLWARSRTGWAPGQACPSA